MKNDNILKQKYFTKKYPKRRFYTGGGHIFQKFWFESV
jgi:hypothetical protein